MLAASLERHIRRRIGKIPRPPFLKSEWPESGNQFKNADPLRASIDYTLPSNWKSLEPVITNCPAMDYTDGIFFAIIAP